MCGKKTLKAENIGNKKRLYHKKYTGAFCF